MEQSNSVISPPKRNESWRVFGAHIEISDFCQEYILLSCLIRVCMCRVYEHKDKKIHEKIREDFQKERQKKKKD